MKARDAALNMRTHLSDCRHRDVVTVDLLTGETVAHLCADCLEVVPEWAYHAARLAVMRECADCDWETGTHLPRLLCEYEGRRLLSACQAHA